MELDRDIQSYDDLKVSRGHPSSLDSLIQNYNPTTYSRKFPHYCTHRYTVYELVAFLDLLE